MMDETKQPGADVPTSARGVLARIAGSMAISQNLARELERLRAAINPIDMSFHKRIVDALAPTLRFQNEISTAIQHQHALASQLRDLTVGSTRLADVVRSVAEPQWLKDMACVHRSWAQQIAGLENKLSQLRGLAEFSVAESCRKALVSDRLLAQIHTSGLRDALRMSETVTRFNELASKLSADYRRLIESVPTLPDIVALPDWTIATSSREVFVANYGLRTALVQDEALDKDADDLVGQIEAELSDTSTLLARVDKSLVQLLNGAKSALSNQSPDAARHVLASLRELWTHLLHLLAPDERVVAWIQQPDAELLHNGRPTRKARLLYLSRDIRHEPLSRFVASDSQAAIELINVFQRVHELSPNLTVEQLRALILRTESWIMYVLRLND